MTLDRTEWLFLAALALSVVDGVMTIPHWQLEGNPVVLALGPEGMLAVKAIVGLSALAVYRVSLRGSDYSFVGNACAIGLCSLYGVVVISNAVVLMV